MDFRIPTHGTSGMTSQAYGQHDLNEITRLLLRSVGVGLFIALCLLILQYPILKLAFTLIQTTPEVEQLATTYFYICIWGAPATLGLYGFAGWFIGMQNSRFPMYIAITQNIVNIVASLSFVYLLDMKVAGVATGTLIAQYAGFFMAILLYMRYYSALRKRIVWKEIIQKQAMYRFFQVNRDIFFRTLCLVVVTMFFTSAGAAQGEIVLAVNTLLMQLFTLFSYIMDGFAYAGEALAGRYIGAKNQTALRNTVHHLFYWGLGLSLIFTILYAIGGKEFLGLLTNDTSVINASDTYFYWALIIPLAGFPLSCGMEYLLVPPLPVRCLLHVSRFRQLLRSILRFPILSWEITPCGWLFSFIFPCEGLYNLFGKANNKKSNRIPVRLSDKLSLYLR